MNRINKLMVPQVMQHRCAKSFKFILQRFLFLLMALGIHSCKNSFFYNGLYTRADRKAKYFENQYPSIESVFIPRFETCHKLVTGSRITNRIYFLRDSIDQSLLHAYGRYFNSLAEVQEGPRFFDHFCGIPTSTFLQGELDFDVNEGSIPAHTLLPTLQITSASGRHIVGGGGMEFSHDTGDDIHRIEYKLITSIYSNDTLIYMDNRTYWTEIISERDEQLTYHVPQVVIDSLVTLSLQEYFKRLEQWH